MIHSKKNLSLILVVILSVASASPLRTAVNDIHSRSLEGELTRYVIKCKASNIDSTLERQSGINLASNDSIEVCLSTMMEVASDMEVKHKLKMVNAIAVAMTPADLAKMEEENYEVEEDPGRSINLVESSRGLKNQRTPFGIDMVRAQETWDEFGVRGKGIKVCVMDSGLFSQHTDLTTSNLSGYNGLEAVTPWNEDTDGHGTHVTGIIAAADNNQGVVGVAPGADIHVVRVFDSEGLFFGSDVTAAAEICRDTGARIINMSLGGPRGLSFEDSVFNQLSAEGIMSIAAAGNSGDTSFSFPASYPSVVSVAAVDSNRNLASFSQHNSAVDVAAPGVQVLSIATNNGLVLKSGTSMASPHVAGVVALMMSFNQDVSRESILTALEVTANNPDNQSERTDGFGHGIVDAFAAVTLLSIQSPDENKAGDSFVDSPLRFTIPGMRRPRSCTWVGNRNTSRRCGLKGIRQTCTSACKDHMPERGVDSPLRFQIPGRKRTNTCTWVNRNTSRRCGVKGVRQTCTFTCKD